MIGAVNEAMELLRTILRELVRIRAELETIRQRTPAD